MNVTQLAGWILVLFAVVYLGISIADFGPEYAAASTIGDNAEKYGLSTNATNIRFKLGFEVFIDVVIAGVIGIAGWWLTTSEVVQTVWIVIIGIISLFSIVIRATPVLPLNVAKVSPGGAFYGAQVQLPVLQDISYTMKGETPVRQYVVITKKQAIRTALAGDPKSGAKEIVVLDLSNKVAADQYMKCSLPLTITGNVWGTGSIAKGKDITTHPLIRVKTAKSGLPEKK